MDCGLGAWYKLRAVNDERALAEIPASEGEVVEPQTAKPSKAQRLFVVEVWIDYRNLLKAMVGDCGLFGVILAILTISHYALDHMNYPAARKETIEKVHFWAYFAIFVITLVALILRVSVHEFRSIFGKQT